MTVFGSVGPFGVEDAGALLDTLGAGAAVTVTVLPALLTTAQAADVLGTSRGYVAACVDDGTLPARFGGLHRRIRREDVVAHAHRMRTVRSRALDAVAELARREGLYDDDF